MATQPHMVRLAAVAGARLHRVALQLQEQYQQAPEPDTITYQEAMQHHSDSGHMPAADPNCTDPICLRAHKMIAGAMATISQRGATNG